MKQYKPEAFLPAPDHTQVEATITNLFDPVNTVRYGESSPMPTSFSLGQRSTRLFIIEQARTDIASVYELRSGGLLA